VPRFISSSLLLILSSFVLAGIAAAQQTRIEFNQPLGLEQMQRQLQSLKAELNHNDFGAPFYLQSTVKKARAAGNVYALLPHHYQLLSEKLSVPQHWCEAMNPHINVKGCVYDPTSDSLQLFVGTKGYQPPEDAFEFNYRFSLMEQNHAYTYIKLSAKDGPFDTGDHAINIEFIPVSEETSFIRFGYSARYGAFARFALKAYLATFGRNKVGFTQIGKDEYGKPTYIKGVDGVIERNAMRYYFALHSYFDTLFLPEATRFNARMNRWFDFAEQYPRQLHEVEREEYLAAKEKQHRDQAELSKTQ
jgi:hypothetical protein